MTYEPIERNKRHVDDIVKEAKKADSIYLATDLDREGEAISWHVSEILRGEGLLDGKDVHRVVFSEITPRAIKAAVANPRGLSHDMVDVQQARRALDYLVGFNLSPVLWRKVQRGLSAGRVQSPALRMIVEREQEIDAFKPREYWTVEADLAKENEPFGAKLHSFDGERLEQFSIDNETRAREVEQALLEAAQGKLRVAKVERKQRRRNPAAPFTTSTLQQEASRKLGFTTQRTMRVAQQLYEGIDLGQGAVGLITYMRTDSVSLSAEAVGEIRDVIAERYGSHNVPARPQVYRTKAKNAQEAHEAIRPTAARNVPERVRDRLSDEQYRLYELIWKRAVACQMIHATINTVSVDLTAGPHNFRATGSTVADPGFMAVYQEGRDDKKDDKKEAGEKFLPELIEGEDVELQALRPEQHFTEPPPRYSEASLVRTLEEYGIGRPSTYAAIISTLQQRKYVELESRRFYPTDVGKVVNRFLTDHFDQYVDYEFTARLEDDLDAVSRGERDWVQLMEEFWGPFHDRIQEKANISREEVMQARELGIDPKSGRPVSVRLGRFGPFVQLGTKDDEEKPKFAGLRPHQKLDSITLEEALELFKLPRDLGETPEGEPLQVNIGRFGPYVRYGNKFASLQHDDPYTVTRERALEVVAEKKAADANRIIRDFGNGIQILRGRYGPYITNGKKNARVPKDREPESLGLEECEELIAKAPERKARGGRRRKA